MNVARGPKKIQNTQQERNSHIIGIVQTEFYHVDKWDQHKPGTALEYKNNKILWDFDTPTDQPIQAMTADLIIVKKRKRIWQIIAVPEIVDHRGNIKGSEKLE